jgi:hypothetical protein
MTRIVTIHLCIFALTACGNGDSPQAHIVLDSAGVRIVVNSAPTWTSYETWSVEQTPALSIGDVRSAGSIQLFRVVDAVRLSNGMVVVGNGGSAELLFVEADGTLQAVIGSNRLLKKGS